LQVRSEKYSNIVSSDSDNPISGSEQSYYGEKENESESEANEI
jgi:hypothetical protein